MAVTVNIYYSGENGNARKFAEKMVSGGVDDDIRAEAWNTYQGYAKVRAASMFFG